MTDRSFVDWAQPAAATLARDRAELIAFARSMPDDYWLRPSVVEGWTNHDLLAHLAGGNDQLLQTLLRAVTAGEMIAAADMHPDTDAENSQRVVERRPWSIAELIHYLERDDEDVQDMMAKLLDSDRDRRPEGLGMTVAQFLRIVEHERHDREHLMQLKAST